MAAAESSEDLLAVLTDRVRNIQLGSASDKPAKTDAAAAQEASAALDAALLRISSTPKEELPETVRCRLDAIIVDLDNSGGGGALKRPLLNSLKRCGHYRAFLGLPRTLECARRHLTKAPPKRVSDIFEGKEGLAADVTACTRQDGLQWVEPVLRQLAGEGRFKRELGGFELSSSAKGKVRAVINLTKKRIKELEGNAVNKKEGDRRRSGGGSDVSNVAEMERDVRLIDQERRRAQSVGVENLIDKAMMARKK